LVRQVGGGVQADLAPAGDSGERSAGQPEMGVGHSLGR
jgi:hypothetical protein